MGAFFVELSGLLKAAVIGADKRPERFGNETAGTESDTRGGKPPTPKSEKTTALNGTCYGNIPYTSDEKGHRWHLWTNGWLHYKHHCPACLAVLHPQGVKPNSPESHRDAEGHRVTWNGTAYAHFSATCEECLDPCRPMPDDPRLMPGRKLNAAH